MSTKSDNSNSQNMTSRSEAGAQLAYAALDDIPTPKADAKEIVGLVKSSSRITGYQLSDGTTVSISKPPFFVPCILYRYIKSEIGFI